MHADDHSSPAATGRPWLGPTSPVVEICDDGLVFGAGSHLVRMVGAGDGRRLALDADRDRALALLSVVCRRLVGADMLVPNEAASRHWQRGDKALANLRLVFAGLPRLEDSHDAPRLRLAEYCLDEGMSPRALMEELGLDPAPPDFGKYNRDEARVPAGNGIESGRWTFGPGGAPVLEPAREEDRAAPGNSIVIASNELFHRPEVPAKESADAEDPIGGVENLHHLPVEILPIMGPVGGGLPVEIEPSVSTSSPIAASTATVSAITTETANAVGPGMRTCLRNKSPHGVSRQN